nr:voltage-dependent T-type calcium channel subunit alpha-1G-like [Leptinotarsa decemlineata]
MSADNMHYYPTAAFPSAGYTYCRSGSDSRLHRRGSHRDVVDAFDSGDSTLSDMEESESGSGSGSGVDVDPNLPYPGIAPITLRYLSQTTRPRSWCLALISNPYPFLYKLLRCCRVYYGIFHVFRYTREVYSLRT